MRLHPESPLGATVLECYHTGSRNIFALGFVPVKADNTMVLLSRDTPPGASCVKELDLDLNLWEPIIQVRCSLCSADSWRACTFVDCDAATRYAWTGMHCMYVSLFEHSPSRLCAW